MYKSIKEDLDEILIENVVREESIVGWKINELAIKAEMLRRGIKGTIQIITKINDKGEMERVSLYHRDHVGDYLHSWISLSKDKKKLWK